MKKGLKKILSLVLEAAFAIVMLPAYSFAEEAQTAEWALYIYMCGTDLETNWGCGADDLLEMIGADIPDNRKAAVFTGGTYEWDPCGDGTDCGSAYIKPSTEYNQLFLPDDDGMLDLYDFMYQAKEIDRFRTAAEEVIKALGSPTGSDKPGYDGHVTPEYYVGDTVGDGAVIYRGTGFCFNRSVGMSFFYPVAALDIPIPYVISGYLKGSGIEDSLGTYMEYLMATLEHDFPSFRAEMNTEFDKEDYTLSLSVDPKEQVSPALAVFDNETQSTPGEYYFFENDAAELDTAIAWDYEYYLLPVTMEKLVSTNTTTYASYFMATDLQNEIHLTEAFNYAIIESFVDIEVSVIPPQEYTGSAIKPEIHLTYHGGVLEELDYTVTYSNNVEKGTSTVTATSLMEDLPGELTAAFTICDFEELAEEAMKLLPYHDLIEGCFELAEEDDAYYYEYVEHIRILEAIKRYYGYGSPLSEASLKTLNEQYGLLLDYLELTLTDKGVELVGLFTAFGDSRMTLSVESKTPDSEALDSISDKAEKTDCLLVTLLGSDGEAKEIPDGESVTLSITLDKDADTDNIELYLLTDADAKPVSLEYRIAETDDSVRLVFDTAALGYFTVVYQADTPADEEPDDNPPTGVLLVTAPFIAAAGAMIFRKRR